jgi:hypothetical protein
LKNQDEKTWRIVDGCVPRGTAEKLARTLARSPELINRWKRPPLDEDDSPHGTGALNPLDLVEAIQDHAFAHAPREAHRVHLYFQKRFEKFSAHFAPKQWSLFNRDKELADLVREHSQFVASVLEGLPPERVRAEWEEMKREGEEIVRMIESAPELRAVK